MSLHVSMVLHEFLACPSKRKHTLSNPIPIILYSVDSHSNVHMLTGHICVHEPRLLCMGCPAACVAPSRANCFKTLLMMPVIAT